MKRGRRYGSVICDLQRRKPIDLLESRTVEDVKKWLGDHPVVQIVTRDGSMEYAKAILEGAPQALQVTDRWHLFYNLSQKIEQFLKRLFPPWLPVKPSESPAPLREPRALTESEQKKWQLIQQVQDRHQHGIRNSDLSREFSINRKTVNKYLELKEPLRDERKGHHSADPYQKTILYLLKQNVPTNYIFHVIQKKGYDKSLSTLRDYILKL